MGVNAIFFLFFESTHYYKFFHQIIHLGGAYFFRKQIKHLNCSKNDEALHSGPRRNRWHRRGIIILCAASGHFVVDYCNKKFDRRNFSVDFCNDYESIVPNIKNK